MAKKKHAKKVETISAKALIGKFRGGLVRGHKSCSTHCLHCTLAHSKSQHASHGKGSFARTH